VVGDVSAIHDLAKEVAQVIPRYLVGALEIIVGHHDADCEVALVERVGSIPPHRSKLLALAHHGVEEAEGEDDRLELGLLRRALPHGAVEGGVRAE